MLGTMLLAAALSATNANSCVATQTASTNMPPRMVSVWKQAQRELRLTAVRQTDGTLDAAAAARRREAVGRAFARVCQNKGLNEADIAYWRKKLYE